jgi:hypothetical protein
MDKIVNWFTLLIVLVFDPLAIAMVIALNKLVKELKENIQKTILENDEDLKFIEKKEDVEEDIESKIETPIEEKPEVIFEPTTEEGINLYNEKEKSNPKPPPTPSHSYKVTGADRYKR